MGFQPLYPVVKRQCIVFAKAFYVPNFKPAVFGNSQSGTDRNQFAIREDVFVGEGWAMLTIGCRGRYPMIQKHASRAQQAPGVIEVLRHEGFPYVLKHANAGNLVEPYAGIEFPIVANVDFASSPQSLLPNRFATVLCMFRAQSDADTSGAVVEGGMDNQCSPPTAYVEQPITPT